jgi:hypothetical protein
MSQKNYKFTQFCTIHNHPQVTHIGTYIQGIRNEPARCESEIYLDISTIPEASIIVSTSISATLKALSFIKTVLRTWCHTTAKHTNRIA